MRYCTSLVSPYASLLRLALGLRLPNSYVGLAAYVVLLARPELPPAVVSPAPRDPAPPSAVKAAGKRAEGTIEEEQ